MEQDSIKLQIQYWLSRKTANLGVREVFGLPVAIGSDVGLVREENQDRAVILRAQVSASKFFLVGVLCDGMGGMSEGQDCASLTVASFISSCIRNRNLNLKDRLLQGVELANKDVYQKYGGDGGATLSAFILDSDGNFEAVNVGDSRIYVSRNGGLEQISVDDTIAGQLKHQPAPSLLNNKLLQFIGIGEDLEPHLLDIPSINELDSLLLTSDGVHFVEHGILKSMSMQKVSSTELTKRLLYVAKWCGGRDNASVIAISDLNSFFYPSENVKTGTVQLWDAFGDVQFIGVEKSQPSEPFERAPQFSSKTPDLPDGEDSSSLGSPLDPVEKTKPSRKRKSKRTDKVENTKTKKPQLRIDFDD